jgi:hypothetical protein
MMRTRTQVMITFTLMILAGCNQPAGKVKSEAIPATKSNIIVPATMEKPDYKSLVGEYLRSDGDYTIKILSGTADGKLDVAYFNPNPIHVAKANWEFKNNTFVIGVELRDVNYPGSTYILQYFPVEKKLAGKYYQAVEKVYYDVEFSRIK